LAEDKLVMYFVAVASVGRAVSHKEQLWNIVH